MSGYNPITPEEIASVLGDDSVSVAETIATLIEKKIIFEHHDGGFFFNEAYVDHLLYYNPEDEDVWLG